MRPAIKIFALTFALAVVTPGFDVGAAAPAIPIVVIDGKGHGHGVGMPQDGALAMGKAGSKVEQIMAYFYPGTAITRAAGSVRVQIAEGNATGTFTLGFPEGGDVRGGPISVRVGRGGRIAVSYDGAAYRAEALAGAVSAAGAVSTAAQESEGATSTTTPEPTPQPTAPPAPPAPQPATAPLKATGANGGVVVVEARNRQYRGVVEAVSAGGRFRLVNDVDVEDYLRGMGEVRNPSWPAAGLEAQAIAARTYALRAAGGGQRSGSFHLYDDQRSQVYLGRQVEYAAMDGAVARTRGRVVTYNGSLAATVYSAGAGGFTATATEGFGPGASDRPYLKAVQYPTADPKPWHVEVSLTDLAARLGYGGKPTGVSVVARGPSGRALKVRIDGSRGAKEVDGVTFDAKLGLKSTLFTLRGDVSSTAPPSLAPPEEPNFQELFGDDAVIINESGLVVLRDDIAEPPARTKQQKHAPVAQVTSGGSGALRRALALTFVLAIVLVIGWFIAMQRSPYVATLTERARDSVANRINERRQGPPDHRI